MPKTTKKAVAKKATKKSTKKVAKILGTAIHQAAEAAFDNGQFSANGMLNLNVRNNVQAARGEVVFAIRNLVEASIELNNSASLSQSERDVATAAQRLAVARVELALDGLESTVRG